MHTGVPADGSFVRGVDIGCLLATIDAEIGEAGYLLHSPCHKILWRTVNKVNGHSLERKQAPVFLQSK
jgi:hypothetical protein